MLVQGTGVACVQKHRGLGPGDLGVGARLVPRLAGHEVEHVGADVPAPEGGEAPVGLDGGELRVVRVERVVLGAVQLGGDRVAQEDGKDAVGLFVGVVSRRT